MGLLNQNGINEILERHKEAIDKMKIELVEIGIGEDGIILIEELIDMIYQQAVTDNNCQIWEENKVVLEFRKLGINKWGKEAKNKLYQTGIKTTSDLNKIINVAQKFGVLVGDEENNNNPSVPIYEGWE